jgi:spore maturation protein A
MSWIWAMLLTVSILCAIITDNGSALAAAIPQGAQAGITLAISIAGSLCLWSGIGKLMERIGLTEKLSKLLHPLLIRLFPRTRNDALTRQYLSANICANFLGLGNAATPMGIQAAKRLTDPRNPELATDELCRLIVLNTASIQLIPANVAAVRASLGCAAPFDILPMVWLASICSAALGLVCAYLLGKVWRHD